MFKKLTLENGLRILTAPMQGTNTVTVLVLCGTGSDYEAKPQNGISHFLEHMFFKGTKKRPAPQIIAQEMDGIGSLHNAFTSHEVTGYWMKTGKSFLEQSLELLADIYKNSLLDEKEIEKERQVVVEEMHMIRDDPPRRIGFLWETVLYGNQPAGWDVIGEEKIIRSLKRDDFVNYFYHQYVASNTAVVVAGNFDEPAAVGKVKELFSDLRHAPPIRRKPSLAVRQSQPTLRIEYKETDQTHLALGFHGFSANHEERYPANVLGVILGGGMSSRMFDRLREQLGLAYSVWSEHDSYSNRGSLVTYAGVAHENVERAMRAVFEEYKKICEDLTAEELKRVKDYIRGITLIQLESSNAMANFVGGEEMLTGKPLTIDEFFAKIDAVTARDIQRLAQDLMRPERLNLAMIGPFRDPVPFEKLLHTF